MSQNCLVFRTFAPTCCCYTADRLSELCPDRSGYETAAKSFNPADLEVNLSGRSFMVTGANSGIGKATVQEIAKRGEVTTELWFIDLTALLRVLKTTLGQKH